VALPPELRKSTPPTTAQVGLGFCDKLFSIDRKFKDVSLEDRYANRIKESKPHLDRFKEWLDVQSLDVAPKSALGTAIKYCLNSWTKLTAFLLDGRLKIDNTATTVASNLSSWAQELDVRQHPERRTGQCKHLQHH